MKLYRICTNDPACSVEVTWSKLSCFSVYVKERVPILFMHHNFTQHTVCKSSKIWTCRRVLSLARGASVSPVSAVSPSPAQTCKPCLTKTIFKMENTILIKYVACTWECRKISHNFRWRQLVSTLVYHRTQVFISPLLTLSNIADRSACTQNVR